MRIMCFVLFCFTALPARGADTPTHWLYVGTYTKPNGAQGIYRFAYDAATGKITDKQLAAETKSPSFLAIHPNGNFLYAVGEYETFNGQKGGGVLAYSLDAATGKLGLLNAQSSGGAGPCHISIDPSGKCALVANYSGGSAAVLRIGDDGKLAPASSIQEHKGGSGVVKSRQEGPHAHSINLDRTGKRAFVADLGLDRVFVYNFVAAAGTLTPNDPPHLDLVPGAGPRHVAVHLDDKRVYIINELNSTITVAEYDPARGGLTTKQTITTLPAGFSGSNYPAEIVVHPSGKFVYGSNRGHNSIAAFSVDPATGELKSVGHATEGIKEPRNFAIDPTGNRCVVASQNGDSLVVFKIDPPTGKLAPTGAKIEVPAPVCLRFVPIKR